MKTYEEMAQSALTRGKAIRKQRNRTKAIIFETLSILAICCIVILIAFRVGRDDSKTDSLDGGVTSTESTNDGTSDINLQGPLNYGTLSYLTIDAKTSTYCSGYSYQCISGASLSEEAAINNSPTGRMSIEFPNFSLRSVTVIAKAVEQYPEVYEELASYGGVVTYRYRLFRMEVIDPLQSEFVGTFYYLLPEKLKGDLTQYDALLISMNQLPKNYVLRVGDQVKSFGYLFSDPDRDPSRGNMIPFNDGVFDETLWQDESWSQVYQYYLEHIDATNSSLLVYRGCTLEETLQCRQAKIKALSEGTTGIELKKVSHFNFSNDMREAMSYVKPFENGVFDLSGNDNVFRARRCINGCPTNELIKFDFRNKTVINSEYRFEDEDFQNLPDIATYVTSLDLSKIKAPNIDTAGKVLLESSATGWYEKTENGVYSIVRIFWWYYDQDEPRKSYMDKMFILLDETGDYFISAEDLTELIGENSIVSIQ